MSFNFIPGSGNPKTAKIILVGEQPGKKEAEIGKCFIGPAGQNLDDCLQSAGILRSDCYLTNVIKDFNFPLENYINQKGSTAKSVSISEKGNEYLVLLKEELSQCSANIIVPLGNIALWTLTGRWGITNWRGSLLPSTFVEKKKILPTFHPATFTSEKLFANPDAYLNKHLIVLDLQKAKKETDRWEILRVNRSIITKPNFDMVKTYLSKCKEWCQDGNILMYDIELTPSTQELSCISFSLGEKLCLCIPFINSQGDYFNAQEETEIMLQIAEIMENPTFRKGGQNVIFDSHFLLRKYGIRTYNLCDTMVAQRILYPEYRVGLNFITSLWTDIPYYKEDGKVFLEGGNDYERGWNYNCLDSLACAVSFPKQLAELEEKGNIQTYEKQIRLIEPLTYMMEHGIKIDLEGMKKAYNDTLVEIEKTKFDLNSLVGFELNSNSPKQIREYFYEKKGLRPHVNKGKITVDEDALTMIANKGFREASLVLKIRRLVKKNSTYLNPKKVDPDGRIRCSYNPVGTKFGRISSSENIFGTGTNLQNVPQDVFSYFIADDDYVVYSLDMSQIEARIVAYVGNISTMMEVFEKGTDIHRMTAALIFQKYPEDISNEPGSTTIGNGDYSERDIGKISNHAFNYGYGPGSFSIANEIPLDQAKWIFESYHSAYPGVRNGYWEVVKSQLRENRTLTNLYGRKVTFLNKWSDKFLNTAYSCIPQGSCGDHLNEKGINFTYYNETYDFKSVELLTQIHDSLEFQVPIELGVETHARILTEIKKSLETPLEYKGRKFVVPADLTVKKNLNKRMGIEIKGSKFSKNPFELASKLEEAMERLGIK